MRNIPKISVIVPVYNVGNFIEHCIQSILNQTFVNFELIMVNDGSTDHCLEIIQKYSLIDDRIIVINKENGGLLSARKSGFKASSGEYIAFVDGDDFVDRDFLSAMFCLITVNNADLVVNGHVREFEGKFEKVFPFNQTGVYTGNSLRSIKDKMIYSGTFCKHGISTYVWNKLYRKSLLEKVIYNVPNEIVMGEDAALTYTYISISSKLVISSVCHYYYRQRPNSIVKSIQRLDIELRQLSILFNYLYTNLLTCYSKEKLRQDLSYYLYSQLLVRTGGFYNSIDKRDKLIPFKDLRPWDRTMVYSSGSFGQRLVKFNEIQNNFSLVKWIDSDYEESRKIGLHVDSIYSISNVDFDSLLIASIDWSYIDRMIEEFNLIGIDTSKIKFIDTDIKFIIRYLATFGFSEDFKLNKNR